MKCFSRSNVFEFYITVLLFGTALTSPLADVSRVGRIKFNGPSVISQDSLQNIHIEYLKTDLRGELSIVYGGCDVENHRINHRVGSTAISSNSQPTRFVWIVPENAPDGACLHAFIGTELLGSSTPIFVSAPIKKRQSIADVADTSGPWFDGVAYMKSKNNSGAFIAAAKDKSRYLVETDCALDLIMSRYETVLIYSIEIAIIGGGMSGLLTSLLLQSVGVQNWKIMESSQRVGG